MKKKNRDQFKHFLQADNNPSDQVLRNIRSIAEYEVRDNVEKQTLFNAKWITAFAALCLIVALQFINTKGTSEFDELYEFDQNLMSELSTLNDIYEDVFEKNETVDEEDELDSLNDLNENINLTLDEI